ncbi:MAG: oligosaccharide flippase family protein [Acidobacteriaceae bacterium]
MVAQTKHWARLRNSAIVHDLVSLSGMQIAGYLAPLVTLPYLARVLGPVHLGLVAFAQSFGLYAALLVEFGFSLSGTRDVAKNRNHRKQVGDIFARVLGAKLLLGLICVIALIGVTAFVSPLRTHKTLMYVAAGSGVAQGLSAAWFYQGIGRIRLASAVEICSKALFAASVFIFVHAPSHDWRVPLLQLLWYGASACLLTTMACKEFPVCRPKLSEIINALRSAASLFIYKGAVTFYVTANTFILGLLATPISVAYYATAEKINNVLVNSVQPLTQAVYPRMNHLVESDELAAARLAKMSLIVGALGGCVLGGVCYCLAPIGVRWYLGTEYAPVAAVLRILSLAVPLFTCNIVLGFQYLLPFRLDRQFNLVTVVAGAISIASLLILVPRFAHLGVAWSVVLTESFTLVSLVFVLLRRVPEFVRLSITGRRIEMAD